MSIDLSGNAGNNAPLTYRDVQRAARAQNYQTMLNNTAKLPGFNLDIQGPPQFVKNDKEVAATGVKPVDGTYIYPDGSKFTDVGGATIALPGNKKEAIDLFTGKPLAGYVFSNDNPNIGASMATDGTSRQFRLGGK